MDRTPFDNNEIEEYAAQARAKWGDTKAYAEYAEKSKGRTAQEEKELAGELTAVFAQFGALREKAADSDEALALVQKLQACITKHCYTCTLEILASLGQMYTEDDAFRRNIDKAGGEGTAAFVRRAIEAFCAAK